jgi:hypothetical protein
VAAIAVIAVVVWKVRERRRDRVVPTRTDETVG